MKFKARLNEFDLDMIEFYTEDYLAFIVHADMFPPERMYDLLSDGQWIEVEMVVLEKE